VQALAARWGVALVAASGIAAAGRWKRALSVDGALAATAVGTVTMGRGGLPASAALVAFFVTSSALSRFKQRVKERRGVLAQAKGGERDAWQVAANGGVAAACLLLPSAQLGTAGFLGALATAGADTWATELGLLARRPPRLVTSLRPVQPGASGGVTPEGTLAALGGALAVGATWAAGRRLRRVQSEECKVQSGARCSYLESLPSREALAVATVTLVGVLGSLVDSLLGATVQAEFWCPACVEVTEAPVHPRCGRPTDLTQGWRWVTNDVVNLSATLAGAVMAATAIVMSRESRA
jgi:uncharacterized protein (TIGR00297 family)